MKLRAKNLSNGAIIDPELLDTIPYTDGSGRRAVTWDEHRHSRGSIGPDGKVVAVPPPQNIALINPSGEVFPQPGFDVVVEMDAE